MTAEIYVDRLTRRLQARGDATVLVHRGRKIGAAEFLASIYRYARALAESGIDAGSVVALLAPNSPDAIAIRYAANLLGAATCYLSASPTEEARRKLIAQIAPTVLVVFPETLRLVPAGIDVQAIDFERLDELAARQSPDPVPCVARADQLAVITSSGGSTGVPKGGCRDFAHYSRLVDAPTRPDRRQLVNGKLAYLSQALVDQTILGGGCVILRDGFDAADTLAQIQAERISDLFLVEPQLFELMDHPDLETTDLSSLRTLVHIGASAPPTLRRRARSRLGPIVVHPYGASETGLVSVLGAAEQEFFTSGPVLPAVEIRFRRRDGTLASPGEAGLIEVRSPSMIQGYRNQPELTATAFRDGWYRSGDLGLLDDRGHLRILGRNDDIVRIGERWILPTDIEDALCRLASVRYAVVVPGRDSGTRVAMVVPWSAAVDEAVCREAVTHEFGAEVATSLAIVTADRVPLTEQGKPDRSAIVRNQSPP